LDNSGLDDPALDDPALDDAAEAVAEPARIVVE
jgi:hypothetical protein